MTLEEQFAEAEEKRRRAEEKKQLREHGLPENAVETVKLAEAKAELEKILEGLGVVGKNLMEVLKRQSLQEATESLVANVEDAKLLNQHVKEQVDSALSLLKDVKDSVLDLNSKFTAEMEKQDKHREKEAEMIADLTQYLKDWS